MAMLAPLADFFIDAVNPKFKFYNRPLCLAVVVGFSTLGVACFLTWMLTEACTQETYIIATGNFEVAEGLDCIRYVNEQNIYVNGPRASLHARACKVDQSSVRVLAQFIDEKGWCEAEDDYDYGEENKQFEPCRDGNQLIVAGAVCGKLFPSFGIALGYAGFIELAITICVLACLQRCHVINKNDSHMRQWVHQVVEEKAHAGEMAAEVGINPAELIGQALDA